MQSALGDPVGLELAGQWEGKQIFGPSEYGTLLIREDGESLIADIAGSRVDVASDGKSLRFSLPNGAHFEAVIEGGGNVRGHWIQAPSRFDGNVFATPVHLTGRAGFWQGSVVPQIDTGTFYLLLQANGETLAAELINPERNLGVFTKLTRLVRDGESISLLGSFRGRGEERVMLEGRYYADEDIIALRYTGRGGGYDFERIGPAISAGFLARAPGNDTGIGQPPKLDDGWATSSMEDVGIDPAPILSMIENEILPAPVSTHDLSIHAVLIARNGKLVVEEYFHGYSRDLPHDSRSAGKSITSVLAAAAMQSGVSLEWDTPVYALLDTDALQREPARGDITLWHLVNMNSGLDCDDRNPESAANEDVLWDNADELDFYEYTLAVAIVHAPGEVSAYCSASAHLAGAVIAAAADQSLLQLIDSLLADPLDIRQYSVPIPPDTHPFMGGGIRLLPRDFLKFPQMILDHGQWNGRQVISRENAVRLVTPEVRIDGGRDYGYLWWTTDYPLGDEMVRAHFMAGNGGQIAMLVPDLQLSIVFNAGNYSDRVSFRIQEELIPKYILPAVSHTGR